MLNCIWQGHTYTYTYPYKPNQTQGVLNPYLLSLSCPSPAPDPFLLPSLPPVFSPRPPSLLSPRPPRGWAGGGDPPGSFGGHWVEFWFFFSTKYRPSVHCTWFLPNFVEFRRLLKNELGDEKIMMPNNQLLSYLFDYWALVFFEYISVSGVERGSFWSKKKFKKLINKDFRAFFLKTDFIFSRPQFSKILISETGYGSRVIQRYFRKKMGG